MLLLLLLHVGQALLQVVHACVHLGQRLQLVVQDAHHLAQRGGGVAQAGRCGSDDGGARVRGRGEGG